MTLSCRSPLYQHSPLPVQELLLGLQTGLRRLVTGRQTLTQVSSRIAASQWLPRSSWEARQLATVRQLAQHAARQVPYYQALFARLGVDPALWHNLSDLQQIPVLTKADVIEAGATMLARDSSLLRFKGSTSGTTGRAMPGWRDRASIAFEQAFVDRQASWAGYRPGDRRAWLRGDPIIPLRQAHGRLWRMNRADNMLMLSSYHLNRENGLAYLDALADFDPVMLQAYPSSVSYLARLLEDRGETYGGLSLRGIVTSSETLNPEDRRIVEERFGCRVFDWYGAFERVAAIGTCEHGNYHVMEDYGLVEFEDNGDGTANLIGTGFGNRCMPLLRYRADDMVVPADASYQCPCGRSFRVVERILGRVDDAIQTPEGTHVVMLDWIFSGLPGLIEAQVVQERLDYVRVRIVAGPDFTARTGQTLLTRARERLGPRIHVELERVPAIERTRSGKFRQIVSHLRMEKP